MPYIRRSGNNFIEVDGNIIERVTLTTVPTAYTLNTITVPTYSAPVRRINIELSVQSVRNSSAAGSNELADSTGVAVNNGSAWYPAIAIPISQFVCLANDVASGQYVFSGNEELKPYISSGMSLTTRFDAISAVRDNLILYGVQTRLKIYFV